MNLLVVPAGQKLIDESLNARIVISIIVKCNETPGHNPFLKMIEVTRDINVVMKTVNEQKHDRLIPFHFEGALGNGFD